MMFMVSMMTVSTMVTLVTKINMKSLMTMAMTTMMIIRYVATRAAKKVNCLARAYTSNNIDKNTAILLILPFFTVLTMMVGMLAYLANLKKCDLLGKHNNLQKVFASSNPGLVQLSKPLHLRPHYVCNLGN